MLLRFLSWALYVSVFLSFSVQADIECSNRSGIAPESTLNVRVDNDLFGFIGQDQGYSNGFLVTLVSPNLLQNADDPCLPDIARHVNNVFQSLQPKGYDELNMTIGFGQTMYTPTDRAPTEIIDNDRPYAGALLFSVSYSARKDENLKSTQLRFGLVGPGAKAGEVQNWWHDLIGAERFNGWDNQLKNEPVFQLIHERRKRSFQGNVFNGVSWDVIGHWGGSIGNFATYANAGFETRLGLSLPDDFGTAPLRPGGENTSPIHGANSSGWRSNVFLSLDTRWVLYDITLDGNSFRTSHSVDKRPLVADIGYGLAITKGRWRFAFARYHRTLEFEGQQERPVFGSFTLGLSF